MPYSECLALIKKLSFESKHVLWYLGKVFFVSNFLISSWISIKIGTNSHRKGFNYSKNIFVLS